MAWRKGDRVMISDEAWAKASSQRRRHPRREGTIIKVGQMYSPLLPQMFYVRWDGNSAAASGFEASDLVAADLARARDLRVRRITPTEAVQLGHIRG